MNKYLAVAGLVLVTVIWGGGFVASDMALGSLLPLQIMAIRFFLATLLLGGGGLPRMGDLRKEEVRAGFFMGCGLFAGFALQIMGLQYTTPSKNAFLTATNVVMVPFFAYLVHRKKVGTNGVVGAIMAIIGVGLLSLERDFSLGVGDALTLLGAVGFALQIFLTGQFASKYRAWVLNSVQMATAFLLSAAFLALSGQFRLQATFTGWASVLYLGVVSTALTYFLQTNCQKYVDETKAAIILSMESVFGTLFSVIILKEGITLRMVAGCVIILAGVVLSNCQGSFPFAGRLCRLGRGEKEGGIGKEA